MDKNNQQKSFTLIELLVVVSVMALFSGLFLAAYNDFAETKKLEGETKKFVEVLELAKKKTLAGDKPCPTYTGSYRVSWTNTNYRLIPVGCPRQLSYDLTDVSILSVQAVIFKPFGLGVNAARTIWIRNNNSLKCRQVTIEKSGNINEQKLACP